MRADRAVTEVLGFVLVIALVTTVIAVVMTTGIAGLEDSQSAEQINNMERGFDVLGHNVDALANREAPSRATELRIAEGSIEYGTPTVINVTVDGTLIGNLSIVTEPLVYNSASDVQIAYEGGAIIRSQTNHSVMLREPSFAFEDDYWLIGAVRTRPLGGSETSMSQPGTILIRGEYLGTQVETADPGSGPVNVTVTSARPDAWEQYFEDLDRGTVSRNNQNVTLTVEGSPLDSVQDVHVVRTRTRFVFLE